MARPARAGTVETDDKEPAMPTTTVLLDLDGVLADFDAGLRAELTGRYGHGAVLDDTQRTRFEYEHDYARVFGAEAAGRIAAIRHTPGFYAMLPVVDGAVEFVTALEQAGWHVAVCSAPSLTNPTCASDKYAWVERHFGAPLAKRTVITKDKTLVAGRYLVDDKPQVTGAHPPVWTHLLVDTPGTRSAAHPERHVGFAALLARIGRPDTPVRRTA